MPIEEIAGGLVGPADLSLSLGKAFDFTDSLFRAAFIESIHRIRFASKIATVRSCFERTLSAVRKLAERKRREREPLPEVTHSS